MTKSMVHKLVTLLMCVFILGGSSVVSGLVVSTDAVGFHPLTMLYVGGSGPGNYTKIQDAVDNASDGDTVFVYDDSAPYEENIAINVSIQLLGEDRNTTSIEGGHYAISIYVDHVTVSGFRIRNVGDFWNCCGFYVVSDENTIVHNIIKDNLRMNGVYLYGSSYNTVEGNLIENNNYHGIRMEYATHNRILNNTVINNRGYGIYLWESTDNLVVGNTVMQSFSEGIILGDTSVRNTLFHNNFVNNTRTGFDPADDNMWDNGSTGNFWSDYTGSDVNNDGIGDSPYSIPGNHSIDRFPLMNPYGYETSQFQITIQGGLGLTIRVKNIGLYPASNVSWITSLISGRLLYPFNHYEQGTLSVLAPGEEIVLLRSPFLLGIGYMDVLVTVGTTSAKQRGYILVFFFIPSS
jgi:parallel beta-helix repeat protein